LAVAVLSLFGASSAKADCTTPQTFTVTNNADDGSPGTLRYLIGSATVQDCDTIQVPAATIVITSGTSPFLVDKSITIQGAGAGQTIIDGNFPANSFPVFVVDTTGSGAALTLDGVTVRNGTEGVDINALGSLELKNSEITSNAVGGIVVATGINNTLIVDKSTVSNNGQGAGPTAGGIFLETANVTGIITNSTITHNKINPPSSSFGGGGIFIEGGQLDIYNSKITHNEATTNGGGIMNLLCVLNITSS